MARFIVLPTLAALLGAGALAANPSGERDSRGPARSEGCETAILRNGFTISYTQREIEGATTRLWICGGEETGYVVIPSDQIEGFERAEDVVPSAPAGRRQSDSATTPARVPEAIPEGTVPVKDPIRAAIAEAARQHQLDPDFLASVVEAESRFNPAAVSPKGAQGLMQLMPQTALHLGVRNAFDPVENVEGGTKYLRQLLEQYHWDPIKALAAYNAGPQRVAEYGGVPPFRETRAYIARIIEDFNRKKLRQQASEKPVPTTGAANPAAAR